MQIFEMIKTVLFGIVEGITEWLPVSSTGHMLLLNEFLPLNVSEEFYSVFEVVIQLGAILAAVLYLWKKIWPFGRAKGRDGHWHIKPKVVVWRMWLNVFISCIPAIIVGLLWEDMLDALFEPALPIWIAIWLIVFGAAFLVVEEMRSGQKPQIKSMYRITIKQAALLGLWQVGAAIMPGASRSGLMILGALLMGISRSAAMEYVFTDAIMVMAGASLLKIFKHGFEFTKPELITLGVGAGAAFLVSLIVIHMALKYIRSHDFKPFGWYRIALGSAALIYFMFIKL